MNNKFIIVITCYNIKKWLDININILKFQSYKNFNCIIIDDHSTDKSFEYSQFITKDDNRFDVIKTKKERSGQGEAFLQSIDFIKPKDEDIIVEIDGDDWLSSVFVLEYLNTIYNNKNIWATYGQYQIYPTGLTGGHYNIEINDEIDSKNLHRYNAFPYSHLKTYKFWLLNKINRQDLIDPKTSKIFESAWDHALCLPIVEMAGRNHIHKCNDILYILNRSDELKNEGKVRINEQKEVESRIRNLKKYEKIC